ncbi:hypothetical protein ES319_A13G146500v1 [Gossypium barbadense]|uniref:Uncharacterized protein n=1 Tax=Gossypium barbadense TaxID=3634 RepID=A0A5J5SZG5_GOSBA|nr:hypothetical protein ES319_A13G146500v1 [Gossypium barbadense]
MTRSLNAVFGIRFTITKKECFSHDVKYEGDTIHVSFFVIKVNSGWPSVDLVNGVIKAYTYQSLIECCDQIHVTRDRIMDFNVHESHLLYYNRHAKDEEALFNMQFEQHWLEVLTDRQSIVNEGMSQKAVHKALYQAAALIGARVLQVFLL